MQTPHFHYDSGWWPRGKGVRFRSDFSFPGEYLYCELDVEHGYWLLGGEKVLFDAFARERRAHAEFLGLKTRDDLRRFVKDWGPITLTSEEWRRGESWTAPRWYWAAQRRLRSLVNLFSAIRNDKELARHLGEFLRFHDGMLTFWFEKARFRGRYRTDFIIWLKEFWDAVLRLPQLSGELGVERGEEGKIAELLESASRPHLINLADLALEDAARLNTTLEAHRENGRTSIRPCLAADDLQKALECMIILDEWAGLPLQICEECTKVFRVETRHPQRYCGPKCSRKVSSRECKKRQRSEQKKQARKRS